MPAKKTWLLRLGDIHDELAVLKAPVIDRAMFELIFCVRRRRALQLMHDCGGWQAGQAFLVDRLGLLQRIEQLQSSPESAMEHRRRERLKETLEEARRHRAGAHVVLPLASHASQCTMLRLPAGVRLQPGRLEVDFAQPEELLARLYEFAQAAATDFDEFRRMSDPSLVC